MKKQDIELIKRFHNREPLTNEDRERLKRIDSRLFEIAIDTLTRAEQRAIGQLVIYAKGKTQSAERKQDRSNDKQRCYKEYRMQFGVQSFYHYETYCTEGGFAMYTKRIFNRKNKAVL